MRCTTAQAAQTEMRALRSSARALPGALLRPRSLLPQRRGAHQRAAYRPSLPRAVLEAEVTGEVSQSRQDPRLLHDTAAAAAEAPSIKPGDDDRTRFQLHWSVDMWKPFYPSRWLESLDSSEKPVPDRLQAFTNTLRDAVSTAGIFGSSEAARYWSYHLTRSGFFMVQGLASLLASRAAAGRRGDESPATTRFENMFRRGWAGPLTEALLMFYQDFELIKEGRYVEPWDMSLSHRQFNPLFILSRASAFLREATDTLRRRDAGVNDPIWLQTSLLPEYYTHGFHYQSDGWLSSRSAKVYETSTETLFVGRQDAMQRGTLVPLADFMAGKDASQLKALEVAAGTGRFATFVKDNYPGLQLTVSDLSPFYLAEARSNMAYWKKQRAADAQLGGPDGTGVTFLQTAAEKLDVPDASQDIVYCVYLFHELPPEVRAAAAKEFARVLKPGGVCILTDSVQLGDRESYDATLGNFGDFQEPYYRSYIAEPLGPLFEAAGLQPGMKVTSSSTKTLSFRKPTEDDAFALGGNAAAAAEAAAAEVAVEVLTDE